MRPRGRSEDARRSRAASAARARGVWFALAALAGLCAGLYFGAARPGAAGATLRVSVAGAVRASASELVARTRLAPDATLREIDREALRAALRAHPWVRDARIVLLPPAQVLLSVSERVPRARVAVTTRGAGDTHWLVDAEGVLIAPATPAERALPELRGLALNAAQPTPPGTRAQTASRSAVSGRAARGVDFDGLELAELVRLSPGRFDLRELSGRVAPQPLRALLVRSVALLDAVHAHALPQPAAVLLGGRAASELPALVFAPGAAGNAVDAAARNAARSADASGAVASASGSTSNAAAPDTLVSATGSAAGAGASALAGAQPAGLGAAVKLSRERIVLLGDGEAPWQLTRLVRLRRAALPAFARAALVDLRFGEQVILRAR